MEKGYGRARKELMKALELDPTLAEAHTELGYIKMLLDWDWDGAIADFKKAIELEPTNADVLRAVGEMNMRFGNFDEAIRLRRRSIELDPVNGVTYRSLAEVLWLAGRLKEAEAAARKSLELNPEHPTGHAMLVRIHLDQSKPEAALAEAEKEIDASWRLHSEALVYFALGKKKEADAALAEYIKKYGWMYETAQIYAFRGEPDKAFESLEKAYEMRDGALPGMQGDPLLRNLRKDRRWAVFMKKMKLPAI
jgi:tetratricopeptide (TPR) repeat protein